MGAPGRVCTPTNSGILEPSTGGLEWTRARSQNAVTEARATESPSPLPQPKARQGNMRLVRGGCAVQIALRCPVLHCPRLVWRAQQCSAGRWTGEHASITSCCLASGKGGQWLLARQRQGRPSPRHRQGVVDPMDDCKSHQSKTEGREKKTQD